MYKFYLYSLIPDGGGGVVVGGENVVCPETGSIYKNHEMEGDRDDKSANKCNKTLHSAL